MALSRVSGHRGLGYPAPVLRSWGIVLAVTLLTVAAPVAAQGPDPDADSPHRIEEAKRLFDAGLAFANQGDWEKALAAFQDAEAMDRRPSIALNIGKALIATGQYVEAIARMTALANDPATGKLRTLEAKRLIKDAEKKSAQLGLTIEPTSVAETAVVSLNGKARDEAGPVRTYYLNAGDYVVAVTAPGMAPFEGTFALTAGVRLEKLVTLAVPVAVAPPPGPRLPAQSEPAPVKDSDDGSVFESPWFWVATGVVVAAAVVVGIVLLSGGDAKPDCGGLGCF